MKSKYSIILFNSQTNQTFHKEDNFMTFEEAVVFANQTRHRLGNDWSTISITTPMKEQINANPVKKT
tara:strand:+ start:901 stop:1101 length:201 start_codon:yes stop_codon:yes gene_type:complete